MTDHDTIWQRALNKALDAGKTYAEASRIAYAEAKPDAPVKLVEEFKTEKSADRIEIERLQRWIHHFAWAYSWHDNEVTSILNGKIAPEREIDL